MGLFGNKKHSIGKTIAELRKEKGWTQIELAEKLQVSDKAISKWEKDNGAPSVEFFPALAELFDVSIDYIMTGNKPEPKIITMSKIELCAKNDDPKLLDNFSFQSAHIKDETGKSLMDYVKQYKSQKVLMALVDACGHQTHYMNLFPQKEFDLPELLELIKIDRETIVLKNLTGRQQDLRDVADFASDTLWHDSRVKQGQVSLGYRNIFNYMVANYDKLTKSQQDYYFNLACADIAKNTCWVYAFPYFIDEAYKNNKKLFEKLIKKIFVNNKIYQEKADKIREEGKGYSSWTEQQLRYLSEKNYFIHILEKTVLAAIENEDYELAEQLNVYTRKKVEKDVFNQAKIKHNKNLSDDEKIIQSCVHYGILNIDELLATKNLKLIKQALNDYSIHPIEILYKWFKEKNWRKLFEYAVDNNLNQIADYVKDLKIKDLEIQLVNLFYHNSGYDGQPQINGRKFELRNAHLNKHDFDIEKISEYILAYKQQVIADATFELDKEKTISDLTKEYFETELAKGNTEIVIVKLCVRLEAILRSTYHYEGDFSKMLNQYCNAHGQEDDGWGYNQEAKFVRYLQKLRKCRNSIVHSEKAKETLSIDEIRYCIDYICNMN